MTSLLPLARIMVFLHLQVGFIFDTKMDITRMRGHLRIVPPFKCEHLEQVWTSWPTLNLSKGKALGSDMVG
jgi:hypothetical protein